MVAPGRVAERLGGQRLLRHRVRSLRDLEGAVSQGLPKAALLRVIAFIYDKNASQRSRLAHRIVPEATLRRRRRLTRAESERTERLARVVAMAEDVLGDPEDTRAFLTTPHPGLGGRPPVEAVTTELGARQIEEILHRVEHGLPA
jgi:putative toxin-antitoxin system antitoxin component (TIGR02293 family)